MGTNRDINLCERSEVTCAYALQVLPANEVALAEAHIASCLDCQHELANLRPVINSFVSWRTDILRPSASLNTRLTQRIGGDTGKQPILAALPWAEPEWQRVAPGIEGKLLATDKDRHRISMLVRLAPRASYPAHTHADIEELHLLDGELWIDDRKFVPGDYNYGAPGWTDGHVWSETGCTCLLVTSTEDILS